MVFKCCVKFTALLFYLAAVNEDYPLESGFLFFQVAMPVVNTNLLFLKQLEMLTTIGKNAFICFIHQPVSSQLLILGSYPTSSLLHIHIF